MLLGVGSVKVTCYLLTKAHDPNNDEGTIICRILF